MLTSDEVERLREAITATIAVPIVGSIEDYSWEAIWLSRMLGVKSSRLYKYHDKERLKTLIWLDHKFALSPQVRESPKA